MSNTGRAEDADSSATSQDCEQVHAGQPMRTPPTTKANTIKLKPAVIKVSASSAYMVRDGISTVRRWRCRS
jgi:hypothetical protein